MEQTNNTEQQPGMVDVIKTLSDEELIDVITGLLSSGRIKVRVGFLPTASVMEDIKDDFLRYQMTVVEVGDLASASEPQPLKQAFKPVYEEMPEVLN